MRLELIIPAWSDKSVWSTFRFRFPYLSVTTLAAVTPPEWEVVIQDENVRPIDYDGAPDVVGLTALTPLAPQAYEIARRFRERGVPVVMGGFHATWLPDEAAQHVDSVVIGEADRLWPTVLADLQAGALKPRYQAAPEAAFPSLPPARRDLLDRKDYLFLNTVQTTRGCPFDCEFCSVTPFYGHTFRRRPLEEVARELDTITGGGGFLFIVDDNIVGHTGYAKELFALLKARRFKWLSQASLTIAKKPKLLQLAQESGCCGLFLGFESLSQEGLEKLNKRFNHVDQYAEAIQRIHDHGIGIQGSFIFGHDWDTLDTFDEVLEFTERTKLESVHYTILTPFPGTRLYERYKAEGRLITEDWRLYDMCHAVFRPKNMTPEELEAGFLRVNRAFYSFPSMFRRLPWFSRRIQVFGPMNVGFRRAWRALPARTFEPY